MDQAYALMRATRRPKINDVISIRFLKNLNTPSQVWRNETKRNETQYICEANYIRYIR